MSLKSLLGSKKLNSQYALISWPEDDALSIISVRKILSPCPDELKNGAICKVKNFEQCLTRVLAVGTEAEMNNQMMEMIEEDIEFAVPMSPKKKRKMKKTLKGKKCTEEETTNISVGENPPSPDETSPATLPQQHQNLLPPEPDVEWYVHPPSPHKQPSIVSSHDSAISDTAPLTPVEKQETNLATLIDMVEGLKMNMERMLERMDKLECAVSESQQSHNITTRDLPPPLPPRNTPKLHLLKDQPTPYPVTHQVSLRIPPGYLVPVKLTDL